MNDSVHRFIDNAGVRLCCERRGSGSRHILFAHGWISSRRMWYDVVERLDSGAYTVHLLDFRGCGLSDRPNVGHDLEGYASDVSAALAAIDAPATLVGHSMGGKLAQLIASRRPANLSRLVLIAPGSSKAGRLSEKHRRLALDAYGSRKRIEEFVRAAMALDPPGVSMQRIVDDALTAQYEHWIGWYDCGRALDFSDRVAYIAVPTLVIAGGRDPIAPSPRVRAEVAQAIPGALFVRLRDAGHNLPVETPAEIAAAITRFAL
ncbi:MAG: alpha/beta hydrolase [Candidatus Eremiobacteraeota bacterium]|nr:alpha/beta hydrolase [Candidatus Eremiobacteraeota bacterium]